jgi:tetratricopeptide (TPR) repeat protein
VGSADFIYHIIEGKSVRTSKISIVFAAILALTLCVWPGRPSFADGRIERIAKSKAIAHYMMGVTYDLFELGPQAVEEYEKAALLDPNSATTRLRLGADYARLGRLDEAINHLVLVQVLDPQDLQSHYLLALIYSTQKKFDKAAVEYEKILKSLTKTNPQNTDIYFYLGQLYYSQHQYDKAIAQFEKILTIEPKNVEMMYFLGSIYVEAGKNQTGIEVFQKAITIDPEHDGLLNSLAYVYAEQGDHLDDALDLVRRALKIDPDNAAYLDSLGWVYFKKGDYVEALKALMKAQEEAKDAVICEHIGDVYLALKQENEAKKYWRKSLDLDPTQKHILEKIGQLESRQSKNDLYQP